MQILHIAGSDSPLGFYGELGPAPTVEKFQTKGGRMQLLQILQQLRLMA